LPIVKNTHLKERIGLILRNAIWQKRGPQFKPFRNETWSGRVGKKYFLTDSGELYALSSKQFRHALQDKPKLTKNQVISRIPIGNGDTVLSCNELTEGDGAIVVSYNHNKHEHMLWLLSPGGRRQLRGPKIPAGKGLRGVSGGKIWVMFSWNGNSMLFCDGKVRLLRFINDYRRPARRRTRAAPDFYIYDFDKTIAAEMNGHKWFKFPGNNFLLWSSQPYDKAYIDSARLRKVSFTEHYPLSKYY
jgi:hypothetical protein